MEKVNNLLNGILTKLEKPKVEDPKITTKIITTNQEKPTRRPYRHSSNLTSVKSILASAFAKKGLEKKVERYEFMLHWHEIVGDEFVGISKPECISSGKLVVRVASSVWAQELSFFKPILLQKLSKYLKDNDRVDDIVFRIGETS